MGKVRGKDRSGEQYEILNPAFVTFSCPACSPIRPRPPQQRPGLTESALPAPSPRWSLAPSRPPRISCRITSMSPFAVQDEQGGRSGLHHLLDLPDELVTVPAAPSRWWCRRRPPGRARPRAVAARPPPAREEPRPYYPRTSAVAGNASRSNVNDPSGRRMTTSMTSRTERQLPPTRAARSRRGLHRPAPSRRPEAQKSASLSCSSSAPLGSVCCCC